MSPPAEQHARMTLGDSSAPKPSGCAVSFCRHRSGNIAGCSGNSIIAPCGPAFVARSIWMLFVVRPAAIVRGDVGRIETRTSRFAKPPPSARDRDPGAHAQAGSAIARTRRGG